MKSLLNVLDWLSLNLSIILTNYSASISLVYRGSSITYILFNGDNLQCFYTL